MASGLVAALAGGQAGSSHYVASPGKTYYLEYKDQLQPRSRGGPGTSGADELLSRTSSNVGMDVPVIFYRRRHSVAPFGDAS